MTRIFSLVAAALVAGLFALPAFAQTATAPDTKAQSAPQTPAHVGKDKAADSKPMQHPASKDAANKDKAAKSGATSETTK